MIRTVVAIENERLAAAVCAALDRGGIPIRDRCRTGAEAIRTVKSMGGGVIVCPGVKIGCRCVIGAGSVVTHDIPDDSVAAGNPARVIRTATDE